MFRRMIWNDFAKSRMVSIIMLLFISAAAALIALAVTLGLQLAGSIDELMAQAKTPHFLQMHAGMIDTARLEKFARENSAVEEFQVLEFLNIEGTEIVIGEDTLVGSVQDNGISTQSSSFDYLLGLEGQILRPLDGEIYVPTAYAKEGIIKLGEKVVITGKVFTVAGVLRDSQMNSPLASSKRFLVSEKDYTEIKSKGNVEYLIEFRLKDLSALRTFEAEYISAGLENNGPAVTYPLFRMMNAISDGLMIAVLLLISVLTVLIACLCIRFTLLAQLEEDMREIGVMKAIGLRISDIKMLYLGKYAVVAFTGSLIGWGFSIALEERALEDIRMTMGVSSSAGLARMWGGIAVLLVCLSIISYVNHALNRLKKISAVQAIRFSSVLEKRQSTKRMQLSRNRFLDINVFLGFKAVLSKKRLYATMLCVVMASTFIMLVPQNLYSTISAPSFSTYMGIGNSDLLIRVQQNKQMTNIVLSIERALEKDEEVAGYAVHTTKRFPIHALNGKNETLKVDLGNHTAFPVYYVKGDAPRTENEIALSAINAEELGKEIGDTLVLETENGERFLTICGIYSDITNGGKTAKAAFTDDSDNVMWCTVYVTLKEGSSTTVKTAEYTRQFPISKVAGINSYIAQTFGPTMDSIRTISAAAMLAALSMTILVTLLMLKMLIAEEGYAIAVMKSIGFTSREITTQFLSRFVLVLFTGILAGTMLANTLGETLAGAVIASFGATSFKFVINPLIAYLTYPLTMCCAVLTAVLIGAAGVRSVRVGRHIKE